MIGAISIMGKTFIAINHCKNNSLTFSLFKLNLIQDLDNIDPELPKTSTILLGKAYINRAKSPKVNLEGIRLPIMYLVT